MKLKETFKFNDSSLIELYEKYEFDPFNEYDALLLLLNSINGKSSKNKDYAIKLISTLGSLENVILADKDDLLSAGINQQLALKITMYREIHSYIRKSIDEKPILSSSALAGEFCTKHFGFEAVEHCWMICLSSTKRIKTVIEISSGGETSTPVDIPDIARIAMLNKANSVILSHNHPGGILQPSKEDLSITRKISYILNNLDIKLIDHIICDQDTYISLADMKMI